MTYMQKTNVHQIHTGTKTGPKQSQGDYSTAEANNFLSIIASLLLNSAVNIHFNVETILFQFFRLLVPDKLRTSFHQMIDMFNLI